MITAYCAVAVYSYPMKGRCFHPNTADMVSHLYNRVSLNSCRLQQLQQTSIITEPYTVKHDYDAVSDKTTLTQTGCVAVL